MMRVPIAVSARHAHLSKPTLAKLFGQDHELHVRTWLSQTGQFAAEETVTLVGPRGRLEHVRLMGPPRPEDQVEIPAATRSSWASMRRCVCRATSMTRRG